MTDRPATRPKGPLPPLPLTILTGFLGAGKTTLLNRFVREGALADAVVLINEFGEIGLDHLLVERLDEDFVLLQSGCLCCTIRGDLVAGLEGLLRRRDNGRIRPFDRVVIETTGLADPAPVLQVTMGHPYLGLRYRLEGVATLVDAVNGLATLDAHAEAVRQVAVADRLLVSKRDLVPEVADLATLEARLRRLNPTARLLDAAAAKAADVLDCGLYDPATKLPDVARWLADEEMLAAQGVNAHRHADGTLHLGDAAEDRAVAEARGQDPRDRNRHDAGIRAFAFRSAAPISLPALDLFQKLLTSAHGPRLLRVKGLVKRAEAPDRPLVIHGVQHVIHAPEELPAWPDGVAETRLVFIVKDMEPAFVDGLWSAFTGAPSAAA